MSTPAQKQIDQIIRALNEFGKENLVEILRRISQGMQLLSGGGHCRIYLEDLTMGSLSCAAAENDDLQGVSEPSFPINDSVFPIPQVYQQKQEMAVASLSCHSRTAGTKDESSQQSYYLLPILHLGRAIGVVSLDRSGAEHPPSEPLLQPLRKLLSGVAPSLNRARKYHQQLLLARRVDEAKKRQAALFMVKSA
ncbi:MAG TPA: GAF domain-containing protein, partial [Pelovirga sp.]|nr:GAF domain-containing protein [Pelovirga sp.]